MANSEDKNPNKEYTVISSYLIDSKIKSNKLLDILNTTDISNQGELNIVRRIYKERIDRGGLSFYFPSICICMSNTGFKFISLLLVTHRAIIVYRGGKYKLILVFSINDLTTTIDSIDNYTAHTYHMDNLIEPIEDVFNV